MDIPGDLQNPVNDEELATKFSDCAHHAAKSLNGKNLNCLIQIVYHQEKQDDLLPFI
jgi:hypothetical protein